MNCKSIVIETKLPKCLTDTVWGENKHYNPHHKGIYIRLLSRRAPLHSWSIEDSKELLIMGVISVFLVKTEKFKNIYQCILKISIVTINIITVITVHEVLNSGVFRSIVSL